jgi:ankyrin repeat protein
LNAAAPASLSVTWKARMSPDSPPSDSHADAFLAAIRHDQPLEAAQLLETHPEIARASLWTACAAGDDAEVAARLAPDPAAAARTDAHGVAPLVYTGAAWEMSLGEPFAERLTACALRLLDAGASPDTWLQFDSATEARIPALYFAASRGNVPLTRLLLERGARPNDGESIYHAAEHDHRACLELLVAHGADPSVADATWGNTPLYFLVTSYGEDSRARVLGGMRWLLEHGANPDVPSREVRETPLHAAARVPGSEPLIDLLLEFGADTGRTRADGATPYAVAMRHGRQAIAAHLAAHGAPTATRPLDHFLAACLAGDEPGARTLLATHPGLMEKFGADEHGRLASAAAENRTDAVRLMLELGFDPARESTWAGTPLHHASWHGYVDITRALLAAGAPVNARDREFGCSPLGWACHGSQHAHGTPAHYQEIVDQLIENGATREAAMNRWGEPPEQMATEAIARHLAERGFGKDSAR